ncbi:MAG: adenine phosphoribosyltransferase [Pirellulaceae bacterium]
MNLASFIRDIPDFPKEGVLFKDITPLLRNHDAMTYAVDQISGRFADQGVTIVAGIESRGFLFGPLIAQRYGIGFVPIRKPGKLPYETISEEYELEYGTDQVEMHIDAVGTGDRVLLVDDLLATGGTAAASRHLIQKAGAEVVGIGFVIELAFLNGLAKLPGADVYSLIKC